MVRLFMLFPAAPVDAPSARQNAVHDRDRHAWHIVAVTSLALVPIAGLIMIGPSVLSLVGSP
ncbi:hypothetical protein LQG66_06655 [Bradyrhizobium ontarionense]|uniref:Uncharacterized protein n=1 Tax=Bradyrhizobium ontarionense TaxID=2898149 RepID=A0ABY3RH51_9BRAD|nr:hypothetical protein [Bradyrhizobium sp. A19]UFZ05984.1 hypothetical protein LQG66_06655 [Bradyrhizobium sp. A19]